MSVDARYLQSFRCFEDLSVEQREAVAVHAEAECFYSGHTLFEENEPGRYVFLLLEGEVEVLYALEEQMQECVDKMGPGEIIGCSALVPPFKYNSTTQSVTRIEVLVIDAKELLKLMQQDCSLGFSVQQHIISILMDQIVKFRLGA